MIDYFSTTFHFCFRWFRIISWTCFRNLVMVSRKRICYVWDA